MPLPPSRRTLSDKTIEMLKDQGWYRSHRPGWHRISAAAIKAADSQWEHPRCRHPPSPTLPLQASPPSAVCAPEAGGLKNNALAVSSEWPHPLACLRDGVLHLLGYLSGKGGQRTAYTGAATPSRLEAGLTHGPKSSGGTHHGWGQKPASEPGHGVGGSGAATRGGGLMRPSLQWGLLLGLLVLLWLWMPSELGVSMGSAAGL